MSTKPASKPMTPVAADQVARNPKSYAGEKVTVASKLPMALQIQVCESRVEQRRERSTTWEETVFYKSGPIVVINGTAFPNGDVPEGMERPQMVAGCALTFGVDRDFFERWMEQNAQHPAVLNHMIFASPKSDTVKGMAREFKEIDSMLGPLKHGKDKDGNDVVADKRALKKQSARAVRAAMTEEAAEEAA